MYVSMPACYYTYLQVSSCAIQIQIQIRIKILFGLLSNSHGRTAHKPDHWTGVGVRANKNTDHPVPSHPIPLSSTMASAKQWLAENAKFRVPSYLPPSASTTSASVQVDNVNRLRPPLPSVAFEDSQKVPRFIGVLENYLGGRPLLIDPRDPMSTDGAEEIYANLFYPQVEQKDGVPYDEWTMISSESDVCDAFELSPSKPLANSALLVCATDQNWIDVCGQVHFLEALP